MVGLLVKKQKQKELGYLMGIMSLFAEVGEKKQPPDDLADAIVHAEIALTMIFRNIAAENNNLFIPGSVCTINRAQNHDTVMIAAKKLAICLQELASMMPQQSIADTKADIVGVARALEETASAYQKNTASLADILRMCGNIKTSLERIRPEF